MKRKVLALGIIALVGLVIGRYLYTQNSGTGHTAPVFVSQQTGFSLKLPKVWQDRYYMKERLVDEKTGEIEFRFGLLALDAFTSKTVDFTTVSVIRAIPKATYVPKVCGDTPLCDEGKEIGRNNAYVFISHSTSPEAFGICADTSPTGELFFDANRELCESGAESRSPELRFGAFKTMNIDLHDLEFQTLMRKELNLSFEEKVAFEKQISDFYNISVRQYEEGGGYYILAKKKTDGHFVTLFSGQDTPACTLMDTYGIPKEIIDSPCQ